MPLQKDSFGVTEKCSVFMLNFGQTERQTPVKQYASDLSMHRYKNFITCFILLWPIKK